MLSENIIFFLFTTIFGILLGVTGLYTTQRLKLTTFKQLAATLISKAETEAEEIRKTEELSIKQQQIEQQRNFELHWRHERSKLQSEEERLKKREDKIESRMSLIEKKITEIEKKEMILHTIKNEVDEEKKQLANERSNLRLQIESCAKFTSAEAKEQLLSQISNEIKTDAANLIRRTTQEAMENAEREASKILATAINRLAVPCVSETTINTVAIPNEEMKGRIIGREGRNIRAIERATGVNLIIDDTPGAIVLSTFDPIRMQVAKLSLGYLIQDGRIHPTSIEESVEKAKHNIQKLIRQHGEDAALKAGAMNLHPELINLLGKLKFRFSYGQNILEHSLEVSYLMGIMAAELGLDVKLAKRIGLLHDFGKAVSHEIEGTHAIIGHDLSLRYGESKEVANGIGCHHGEMEPTTIEASLCATADAISASRQGARSESVNEYIKRIQRLEDLASKFPGVEKAYAMQAGREIWVVVLPDIVDDDKLITLASDLRKQIEQTLSYPGKIKVTLVREKRIVEYAT